MKAKFLVLSSFCLFGAVANLSAQTGVESDSPFGHGQDSIRCMENLSLFVPYVKSGNFQDALIPWQEAYAECPASNRNIYIHGVKVVGWQIQNEKDAAKKQELIDKLVAVYDDWAKYFGDREDFPTAKILEKKGMDYAGVAGGKADFAALYSWLNQAIEELQEATNPAALLYFMQAADVEFKAGNLSKEQYIADYLKTSNLMDQFLANASGAMVDYGKQMQPMISVIFTNSGAADCATLESVFGPQLEAKSQDKKFLEETITLFRKGGCFDSEVYFTASGYVHLIEPTAESAEGMAKQSLKKDNHEEAITYYEQAIELTEDSLKKSELNYNIAVILTGKRQYSKARQAALAAAKQNPENAAPYMLIANMYASDAYNVYSDDAFMAQLVFCAAVDKLETARRIDPSKSDEINKLVGSYKAHYPKNEDIFFHNMQKGQSVKLGGWIQETTKIR